MVAHNGTNHNGTLSWFLPSSAPINWGNGSLTLTHSAGVLTISGAVTLASTKPLTLQTGSSTFVATPTPGGTDGLVFSSNQSIYWQFLNGGLVVGAPTGSNKGVGTVNATAVYDDNALLTDLVLDFAAAGTFDREKYAAHPIAREIAAWWLDLDEYAAFWREARHLPGMVSWDDPANRPSSGELITRLTAVVETLAAQIDQLNRRLKAVETREG